jgi:hypothetical protein
MSGAADTEQYVDNHTDFVLDLQTLNWQHRSLVGA